MAIAVMYKQMKVLAVVLALVTALSEYYCVGHSSPKTSRKAA